MTRAEIEKMPLEGTGWDCSLPGPIETIRFKKYRALDGTGYVVLDFAPRYKVGKVGEAWSDWKELEP